MLPFRRCHIRRWGGALRLLYRRGQIDDGATRRWFHGFDGAGLWYRRRGTGHDANGTVVDGLTEIDGDTIILKRRAGQAPTKFPAPHIGARVFEVPNSHRHRDDEIIVTSSGAPCLPRAAVRCHSADVLHLAPELRVIT